MATPITLSVSTQPARQSDGATSPHVLTISELLEGELLRTSESPSHRSESSPKKKKKKEEADFREKKKPRRTASDDAILGLKLIGAAAAAELAAGPMLMEMPREWEVRAVEHRQDLARRAAGEANLAAGDQ